MTPRMISLVTLGFVAAVLINFVVLPGDHIVSSLYLIPVLVASHRWRAGPVAAVAAVALVLYFASAQAENRPAAVWVFGVLALLIGGYLTVRFAVQREEIARLAQRETEDRRRLQVFIGMVAHDLAGAVTNVRAGMEMLDRFGRRDVSEEERVAKTAIDGGVHQMERLLGDLRDAAAIGSDRFVLRLVTMDLVDVARQVVERQRVTSRRHRMLLDAPGRLDGVWDRERLEQLLANLVSNACKYSPDGGEVRVRVGVESGGVAISVRDQGIGIDVDQRSFIFEPFARLQARDDLPGTGLGLWIAKAIVDAHGGRIWVESAVGDGSTFSVSLPLAPPPGSPAGAPDSRTDQTERVENHAPAARRGVPLAGNAHG